MNFELTADSAESDLESCAFDDINGYIYLSTKHTYQCLLHTYQCLVDTDTCCRRSRTVVHLTAVLLESIQFHACNEIPASTLLLLQLVFLFKQFFHSYSTLDCVCRKITMVNDWI